MLINIHKHSNQMQGKCIFIISTATDDLILINLMYNNYEWCEVNKEYNITGRNIL